jgi:hypothetical protein
MALVLSVVLFVALTCLSGYDVGQSASLKTDK